MPTVTTNGILTEILKTDPTLPSDQVIVKARAQGLTQSDSELRKKITKVRNVVKTKQRGSAPTAASAAQKTTAPKPGTSGLGKVLANVKLVNQVMGLCGGADNARHCAEAVRSCGSVEAFLEHLKTVATISQE